MDEIGIDFFETIQFPQAIKHSIARHPMIGVVSDEEFVKLKNDIQFARISWPVGVEVVKRDES